MARKQTDKLDKKKLFFGEHLEIKPAFMQRPKSMEEVMAEAFSKTNNLKPDSNTTVEQPSTVEDSANLDSAAIETTVDLNSTIASTTIENLSLDKDEQIKTTVDSVTTIASVPTVESVLSLKDNVPLSDEEKLSILVSATVVNTATVAEQVNNIVTVQETKIATVVDNATVAEININLEEIPQRLRTDVAMLKRLVLVNWQALPEEENISSNYWYAYAQAWHWIEDNVITHLDKDSKLTLRHCYRKAFGDPTAKGKFFAGQSLLAQEVGLSKRRIQDVLEIFNLLGWVRKTAHHNRGGYKGTDYEMYLPEIVINYFKL